MMPPRYAKLVPATIAVMAIIVIYSSLQMPLGTILTPAAGLVPLLLGCGTLLMAIVAIFSPEPAAEDTSDPEAEADDRAEEGRKVPRPLLIMIVLGLMIFAFERVGFVVSLLVGSFVLLRVVERRPLILSFIISVALSGGLYVLFAKILLVSLPGGWLEF